ncbi:MAG: hypothetical protein AB1941_01865 [Gemmatimonadota bacterium]
MPLTVYDAAGNPRAVLAAWAFDGSAWRSVLSLWASDGGGMPLVFSPGGAQLAAPTGFSASNTSQCQDHTAVYNVLLHWTNGEPSAFTELYNFGVLADTFDPGAVGANLPLGPGSYSFTLRHRHPTDPNLRSAESNVANVTVTELDCAPSVPGLQVTDLKPCGTYKARLEWVNTVPRNMRVFRDGAQVHTAAYPEAGWTDEVATPGPHTWYVEHEPSSSLEDQEPGPSPSVTLTLQQDCTPVGPAAPPTLGSVTDISRCEGADPVNGELGTPVYEARVAWTNGDLLAETEILVDGAWRYTAALEATQANIPMYQAGSYAVTVRHVRNGIASAASGPITVTVGQLACDAT